MSSTEISGIDPLTGRSLSVTAEGGVVARIVEVPRDTDLFLSAGFVDLQVNGCAGFDLNAETISTGTVAALTNVLLAEGVTTFAPTLITAPEDALCERLRIVALARQSHARVASCVPFVHVEGPHISPLDGYRGAHPATDIRPPSVAEFDRWQQAGNGIVGMVTVSPHWDDSSNYIQALVARGVHVAIGHTHATSQQISSAVDAGARLSTHLGNGLALQIARHSNPLWPQLADDRLTATFIADGQHLPADVFKAMTLAKGLAHSVLVSDLVALAGMPPGRYRTPVGGYVELRADGRLCVAGSELLAGSTTSLARCIGHAVQMAGIELKDALAMATVNPGRFAGDRGRIRIGARADLIRFRWNHAVIVESVWLSGDLIHSRKA